jgi:hypothetical protein
MADAAPPPEDDARSRQRKRELEQERERAAVDRLSRVHGAHELQAVLLALLLPAGSRRALSAWRVETEDTAQAAALRDDVLCLAVASRLPWFEWLLSRMAPMPLATRKNLLEATRRVMSARNHVRPIDRLHWLVMRQRLGEAAQYGPPSGADADISQLHESAVLTIAAYTAFLSRMVPGERGGSEGGKSWYDTVMTPWQHRAEVPPCTPPDIDGLVRALHGLRLLPWMQRPVVVRGWVSAAVRHSRYGHFDDTAADALRLSCSLLDSPLPPDLAEHYIEAMQESPP